MNEMKMPKAGQSMEDGTVVRWLKAEGADVKVGEVLLEVETDKATIEVESTCAGTLRKILCPEGTTVPVHTVIAMIGTPTEAIPAIAAATAATADLGATAKPSSGAAVPSADDSSVSATAANAAAVPPTTLPSTGAAVPPAGVVPVLMPKAGQSVEEAELVAWRVKPGDRIKAGDIIFDVETDKATIEVEATDAGRLSRIVLKEGETVAVLQPVAYLSEDDGAVDAYLVSQGGVAAVQGATAKPLSGAAVPSTESSAVSATAANAAAVPPAVVSGGRVKASPFARKVAAERGVNLAAVGAGKGPGGRILSTDVPARATAAYATAVTPAAAAPAVKSAGVMPALAGEPVRRRMSGMRRAIARNLSLSKQTIPHFYMRVTIDADPLMAFYKANKAMFPCSVNDVVALATARVAAEFPAFRSRVDKEEIVEFPNANIGIAVGMDDGLVVPVLLAAQAMTLQQLAAETRRIADAARKGKIEGMGQGILTITNLGMFGVEEFSAIVNPPEAAILAVGAVREDVIVSGGAMRPGKVMTMTLSADHRIIDGLLAAKFLARLKEVLQAPQAL